ncbi:MAG: hypothetical protein VB064_12715 [Oscillospiraceae bacterium]|nr:hypothetical protein [Oscillospiraceae bacterium]
MYKKVISFSCAVILLFSGMLTNASAVTVINEDVSVETPIYGGMETAAEAQAVDSQLTATASSATLIDDAKEGEFALKVNIANEDTDNYAQYTLVNSSSFSIASFSRVNLWVKPGAGASWVSFYTNGALILSDINKDGKFEVGSDLESGKWSKLTLDLTCADVPVTSGDDLVVRSDEYSVWNFDGVICQGTQCTTIDLSAMVNNDTELYSNNIRFKKTNNDLTYDISPSVLVSNSGVSQELEPLNGTLQNIKITSDIVNISGNPATPNDSLSVPNSYSCTKFAFSGNGKMFFYVRSDGYLYSLDMDTGITSKLSISVPSGYTFKSIESFKVNYDGTILCVYVAYTYIYNSRTGYMLIKFNPASAVTNTLLDVDYTRSGVIYDIQDNGGIVYSYLENNNTFYLMYCYPAYSWSTTIGTSTRTTDLFDFRYVTIAKASGDIFYVNSTSCLCSLSASSSYINSLGSVNNVYSINCAKNDGTEVYLNSGTAVYNYSTKTMCPISINVIGSMNNGYLLGLANSRYYIYNPSTNEKKDITPSEQISTVSIDSVGEELAYVTTTGYLKMKHLNMTNKVNKYLLSFDGKNTWYSYKNGTLKMVSSDKTPEVSCFDTYGMTAEEINALKKSDFDKLYEDGAEIYSVDVAVYFNSVSYEYSPSISSINIITDANSYGDASASTANPLYTAKKTDFAGSKWRYVNKVYPVEVAKTAADFTYFFYADGKYMYYDNSAWHVESIDEISSLISDVKANWINLKLIGMTASEVRSIPKSALTSQFAGVDFSVVYCMRVSDKSTKGYLSMITADYTEDRYESNALTLNVIYSNGKTEQISGMTSTQIEDFMDWLLNRTKSSPNYFSFKVGSVNYYVNYYMISNVSVTEA